MSRLYKNASKKTITSIGKIISKYLKKLKLLDWKADFEIIDDNQSYILFDYITKEFLICLSIEDLENDLEQTILHEILHVKYPHLDEFSIEKLTKNWEDKNV